MAVTPPLHLVDLGRKMGFCLVLKSLCNFLLSAKTSPLQVCHLPFLSVCKLLNFKVRSEMSES